MVLQYLSPFTNLCFATLNKSSLWADSLQEEAVGTGMTGISPHKGHCRMPLCGPGKTLTHRSRGLQEAEIITGG